MSDKELYITAREACEDFMKNRDHSCTTELFTLSTYIHQGKHSLKTVWSINCLPEPLSTVIFHYSPDDGLQARIHVDGGGANSVEDQVR